MAIQGLDHVNIHTSDIQKTIQFYIGLLGLTDGFRPPFNFPGAWLYAGENAVVHLIERDDVPKGVENPVDHIAFEAIGFEETRKQLEKAEWDFTCKDVPESKIRQIFLDDPNGVKLELNFRV